MPSVRSLPIPIDIEYLPEEEEDVETFDIADMLGLPEEEMSEYEIVYPDTENTVDRPANEGQRIPWAEIDEIESSVSVVAEGIR